MLSKNQVLELVSELHKAKVSFDDIKLETNLAEINISDTDIKKIVGKVQLLINLLDQIKEDDEVKRDAAKILGKIDDVNIIACLADDAHYFINKNNELNKLEKINICLQAVLIGSKKIAELFFKEYTPRNSEYIVPYAICSGDTEWVKEIISKWKIDILNKKYCFQFYANILNNHTLTQLYKEDESNKKMKSNLTSTTSTVFQPAPPSEDLPPNVIKAFEEIEKAAKKNPQLLKSFSEKCPQAFKFITQNHVPNSVPK